MIRNYEQNKAELEFRQHVNVRSAAVRQGFNNALHALENTGQLFAAFGEVDREQFRAFAKPLLERYPYIQAFNFHRTIEHADLPAYLARVRSQFPDFVLMEMEQGKKVPLRAKERYHVVDYLAPMEGNEAAFGLDVSPNTHLMQVVRQSVATGMPQATALLKLAQGTGARTGFLVVTPVFRQGMPVATAEERQRAFIGDVAAVFRVGALIEKVLENSRIEDSAGLIIQVYASAQPHADNLVYGSRADAMAAGRDGDAVWRRWLLHNPAQTAVREIDVAGRAWTIRLTTAPSWFAYGHRGSVLALLAGLLLTAIATAYLQSVSTRTRRIAALIDVRTAELQHTNALLTSDIAARQRAETALQLRQRAIDSSANAILLIAATAPDYPIEYVNPAFERITGYSAADVIGQAFRFLQNDYRDQPGIEEIRGALRDQREGHATLRSYRKDGALFWNDIYIAPVRDTDGGVSHFVVTQYDITATKRYEAELEYQANRDVLTGLANRNLLRDRLAQSIAYAGRYGHAVWVVYADLDRFKFINDTLGHQAGDALLNKVAERFLIAVRETDTVARLGGDEFVLILPERMDEKLSMGAVQRIMDVLSQPLTIEGHVFFPTCSTGVAMYPGDGHDADLLVKHAEIAMYRAKETGRNNFQFYTPAMNAAALERLHLEGSLRQAIERDEFLLHYQPQVDLQSGAIVGAEALIRWQHPELGLVAPARFISLAEETGLIVPIGAWVIARACRQAKQWQQEGLGMLRIAVNLSARQFYQHDLVQTVAAALADSGLEAGYLEIELTESLVMTDVERAIAILRDLKALGVHLSIDDFGTGYSSLSYLKRFPIDILKIDQSFVRDITDDADDAAIVLSIISLAHSLRLRVIAEGVETAEQLAYLRAHECDMMQGYYFSKPLSNELLCVLLERDKRFASQDGMPVPRPVACA